MNAVKVTPFSREIREGMAGKIEAEESPEGFISGKCDVDCGGRGHNAQIPCKAASEAQAKEVNENEATAPSLTKVESAV
jgi:hypothetical protein